MAILCYEKICLNVYRVRRIVVIESTIKLQGVKSKNPRIFLLGGDGERLASRMW